MVAFVVVIVGGGGGGGFVVVVAFFYASLCPCSKFWSPYPSKVTAGSHMSCATHSYQCIQYFRVFPTKNSKAASVWDFQCSHKSWCMRLPTGLNKHSNRICTESWPWRKRRKKSPLSHRGIETVPIFSVRIFIHCVCYAEETRTSFGTSVLVRSAVMMWNPVARHRGLLLARWRKHSSLFSHIAWAFKVSIGVYSAALTEQNGRTEPRDQNTPTYDRSVVQLWEAPCESSSRHRHRSAGREGWQHSRGNTSDLHAVQTLFSITAPTQSRVLPLPSAI